MGKVLNLLSEKKFPNSKLGRSPFLLKYVHRKKSMEVGTLNVYYNSLNEGIPHLLSSLCLFIISDF